MPDYSGYVPRRPHALAALASVHEAAASDGRPGRFALKVFHPPPSTNARRLFAIEGWLLAAERQKAAASRVGGVVEILACGRCDEGAFAVMPWHEQSLEPLVDTLGAKGDHLRAVASCLLDALAGWEAKYDGPHGKLKPANVFLTGTGPMATRVARLSDPWFLPGAKVDVLRQADLRAVGAMLAQIVRRRQSAGWPIEDGPEWRALGRPGKAWLAYCNYLMNPRPEAGELTLGEAHRRLQKIPRDAKPVRTALLTVGAAGVLATAGILGYARFCDPQGKPLVLRRLAETVGNPLAFRTEVTPDWALLCRAWASWLGDLERNAERLENNKALWAARDPLQSALADFRATAAQLRPQVLVPSAAMEPRLNELAAKPPEAVRQQLLRGTVAEKVSESWTKVDRLGKLLESWPRWDEMRKLLALLEARGFNRTASALRPRLPAAPVKGGPEADVATVLRLFNDVSLDDTGTLLLAGRWAEISRATADMEASGDRVQAAMPRLILARLADQPSVGDFADSLADPLAELRRRRAQFLDPAVVRERFLKESALQSPAGEVTEADFARWDEELAAYSHPPAADDPRLVPELDAMTGRMTSAAADLEKEAPAGEPGMVALSRGSFDSEFERLATGLKGLRAREIVRRDLPAVAAEAAQLGTALHALEQRLEATLALLRPDIWLRRVAEPAGKLAAAKQRWAAWQQAALGGVTAAVLEKDRPRFRQLRQQERTLRDWIDGLEGPQGFGGLALPDLAALSADTTAALRQLEAARREQAATAVAAVAEWRASLPTVPWAAAGAGTRAPLEAHRQWLGDLPAFGADLDRLGALLNDGFGWNEGVDETVDRLARRAGADALTGRPAEGLAEAKQLARLAASDDRATLTTAAQGGGMSRKLTVWRRLGGLKGWPAGAAELDVDGGLVAAVRESLGRQVKDESRRRDVLAELARETRVRWNRAARNSAGTEAQLAAVFERMDRYGIGEGDLEEPVAYNLTLWRFKHTDWGETDIGRLRTRRDGFAAAVQALPGSAARPEVAAFLQKITAVELVDDPKRKPAASPATAGWREEPVDGGLRTTVSWSSGERSVQLEFQLVQPEDDTPPFYLARREIAVGEFINLVGARPEGRAVIDALPPWARADTSDKPFNKPMSWRPRADFRGIELNPAWVYLPDPQVKGLFDAADLRASTPALDKAVAEKPTVRSPLQQVPPDAARIFVERLVGARLPRPDEWRAVMKLPDATAAGNFRGSSFHELWQFLDAYRAGGQIVRWRPNEGVFLPMVAPAGGGPRRRYADDGQGRPDNGTGPGRLWLASVDDGPSAGGFVNLVGNVWIYLYDEKEKQYYVAGGSALSPPGLPVAEPQKVEATGMIGARRVTEGFSDVGIRPAFDAPPGFRERYKLLLLVRQQPFLTL